MCRIQVEEFNPRYDLTIGWDSPMQPFFAQIEDRTLPGDAPILWIGTSFREITNYKNLHPALASYGMVRDADLAQLWREALAEVIAERGEFGPMLLFGCQRNP